MMILDFRMNKFMAYHSYNEKDQLKKEGFRWNSEEKAWYTDSVNAAAKFSQFATLEAWAMLTAALPEDKLVRPSDEFWKNPWAETQPTSPSQSNSDLGITPDLTAKVHRMLQILAGMCDGARELDGCGFNKLDTWFGKELAAHRTLTPKQVLVGKKMCRKYKKQIPSDLYKSVYGP